MALRFSVSSQRADIMRLANPDSVEMSDVFIRSEFFASCSVPFYCFLHSLPPVRTIGLVVKFDTVRKSFCELALFVLSNGACPRICAHLKRLTQIDKKLKI